MSKSIYTPRIGSETFGTSVWSVKNYETALERLNGLG